MPHRIFRMQFLRSEDADCGSYDMSYFSHFSQRGMRAFALGDHKGFLLCEMIYTRAPAPLFMRLTLSPFYVYYGE